MSTIINVHDSFYLLDTVSGGKLTYQAGIEIGSNSSLADNTTAIAVGKGANVDSSSTNGIAIGNNANSNSIVDAVALGVNATPIDADHSFAIGCNSSSVAPGIFGLTVNNISFYWYFIANGCITCNVDFITRFYF